MWVGQAGQQRRGRHECTRFCMRRRRCLLVLRPRDDQVRLAIGLAGAGTPGSRGGQGTYRHTNKDVLPVAAIAYRAAHSNGVFDSGSRHAHPRGLGAFPSEVLFWGHTLVNTLNPHLGEGRALFFLRGV